MSEQNSSDHPDNMGAAGSGPYVPPPPMAYPPSTHPSPAPYATPYTPNALPRRSKAPLWIVAAFVLLMLAVVAFLAVRNHRPAVVRQAESAEQRREATLAAFGEGAPVDVSDVKQVEGIRRLFTDFTRAARDRDGKGMTDSFDTPRLCDEIAATKLPGTGQFSNAKFQEKLAPSIGASMMRNAQNFAWEGFEFRQIKPLPRNDEVLVYLRADLGEGYRGKFRFWVRRESGKWRIFDFEDLTFGVRSTTLVGSMMGASIGGSTAQANAIIGALQTIQSANQQLVDEDFAGALQTLRTVDKQSSMMPPTIEALRQTLIAAACIRLDDPDAAMAALDKSESLHADQPFLALLRGAAHNAQSEPDKALKSIDSYESLVGPEALSHFHAGEAHLLKGQTDAALDRYRKGLDDTPGSLECFDGLCRVLGEEGLPELRQRLNLSPDRTLALRSSGNAAILSNDADTLQTVIKLFPDDSDPFRAYYQAEYHVLSHENDQAVRIFEANAERFKAEPLLADAFHDEYVTALNRVGRAMEAYRLSKYKPQAFVDAADRMIADGDFAQLQKLIDAHVVQEAGEASIVNHYRGLAAEHQDQPQEAARLLKLALDRQVLDDWKPVHRTALIRVMHGSGRHAEAYRSLGRTWEVFSELITHAERAGGVDAMRELLQLVRADFPTHPMLPWYEATTAWAAADFKTAADLLLKHRRSLSTQQTPWDLDYVLVVSLIRSDRPAEAVAHTDWARQQGEGAGDYVEMLAYAAAGNVPETTRRLSKILEADQISLSEYLHDEPDLSKALAAPAFATWMAEQQRVGPAKPATTADAPATRPAATRPG